MSNLNKHSLSNVLKINSPLSSKRQSIDVKNNTFLKFLSPLASPNSTRSDIKQNSISRPSFKQHSSIKYEKSPPTQKQSPRDFQGQSNQPPLLIQLAPSSPTGGQYNPLSLRNVKGAPVPYRFFREDSQQKKSTPKQIVNSPSVTKLKPKQEKSDYTEDHNKNIVPQLIEEQPDAFYKGMIKFHYVIGKGGFGKVWLIEMKKTKMMFALKEMSKAKYKNLKLVEQFRKNQSKASQMKEFFQPD